MEEKIIDAGDARYLSEIMKDGLPDGVINKVLADVGATYSCANCDIPYIIICPYKDLVDSICNDKNNTKKIAKVYGGVYLKDIHSVDKIAITYDSLPKLLTWFKARGVDPNKYHVVVDEWHTILNDIDYREDAINYLVDLLKTFNHVSYITATPNDIMFETELTKDLPHYIIKWNRKNSIKPIEIESNNPIDTVENIIRKFLNNELVAPSIDSKDVIVSELYIFLNSVTLIENICSDLGLSNKTVKVCCAKGKRNREKLGDISISKIIDKNKKINFFTKKCFQGCNLYTENGLVIVVSDGNKDSLVTDISSDMIQIASRIRDGKTQNCFKHLLVHVYRTNSRIESDEEFEDIMKDKINQSNDLLSIQSKITEQEKDSMIRNLKVDKIVVSIYNDGNIRYNVLKEKSFRYRHKLRKQFINNVSVLWNVYNKFKINTSRIDKFEKQLNALSAYSFREILEMYYNGYEDIIAEHKELEEYPEYITLTECNTLRFSKEKIEKRISDYKKLELILKKSNFDGFVPASKLKDFFEREFKKYKIELASKGSLISCFHIYNVKEESQEIKGKKVRGYKLTKNNI